MHFYEATIITTKDGLHCQVYGNEHPISSILVKPKYIPTNKIESSSLPFRFISGKRMNRLNLWINKEALSKYIAEFKVAYPEYILKSQMHQEERLIFSIPIDKIERIYLPKRGFSELMKIPTNQMDKHLQLVQEFGSFLMQSGLKIEDLGVTYSTLMGHYSSNLSDINFVIHGKANYWKLISFLQNAKHKKLRWKTNTEWLKFYDNGNKSEIYQKDRFLKAMTRKKSEGYFGDVLFVLFNTENENETWFKWGKEKYVSKGLVKIRCTVTDDFSSAVRPGFYGIKDAQILEGNKASELKKIVFYARNYGQLAKPGEQIEAYGMLEEVTPEKDEPYSRVVVGYFDSYLDNRREEEYIKLI